MHSADWHATRVECCICGRIDVFPEETEALRPDAYLPADCQVYHHYMQDCDTTPMLLLGKIILFTC